VTRRLPLLLLLGACAGDAATPPRPPLDVVAYRARLDDWLARRDASVPSANGPLAQTGLCRLEEARLPATIGGADSLPCVIPGPRVASRAGRLVARGDTLTFMPEGAADWAGDSTAAANRILALRDQFGLPGARVWLGPVRFSGRWAEGAITIWIVDTLAEARTAFGGIERWPVDTAWRFDARFIPAEGEWTHTPTVRGFELPRQVAGRLAVRIRGEDRELVAYAKGKDATDVLVVMHDATSGAGSYPSARFLDVDLPRGADGRTEVDFNRARNPDCAFTDASPCPLAPPENRFAFAIPAGEETYKRR
jgi:uncharacterized protein (DUF1684 family)